MGVFKVEYYLVALKRFGRLSYCLIPLDLLLVVRPNIINYLEFIDLHKWISRIIIFAAYVHGLGYYYRWFFEGTVITKLFKLLNFLGVIVLLMTGILVIISIRLFRRYSYTTFYIYHNISVWFFVLLIGFHSRPGVTPFTFLNLVIMSVQIYLMFIRTFTIENLKVTEIESSNLIIVLFPKPSNFPSWSPGSHIRLNYRRNFILPTYPFTIASDENDSTMTLIMKKPNHFTVIGNSSYAMSTPLPSASPAFLKNAEDVVIICGGSGISFGLPILSHFKLASSATVNLIWVTRSKNDIIVLQDNPNHESIQIYITGNNFDQESEVQEQDDSIELDTIAPTDALLGSEYRDKDLFKVQNGRPDLEDCLGAFEGTEPKAEKWLVACGPQALISDCKRLAKKKNINLISEVYEM